MKNGKKNNVCFMLCLAFFLISTLSGLIWFENFYGCSGECLYIYGRFFMYKYQFMWWKRFFFVVVFFFLLLFLALAVQLSVHYHTSINVII